MTTAAVDLVVLHEHPEWQKPLFEALARRGVSFAPFDLTRAAFHNDETPRARLYFNQASPSAYLRGHTRAVPLALAYMRSLELARRPRAQRRQRLRAGVEQECPGHAVADARHRYASLDHLQRSRSAPPVRRRHPMARSAQTGPGRKRRADPGGRIARGGGRRSSGAIRPSGCPTTSSSCRSTCPTTRTRASSGSSSSAASSSTRCV